MDAPPIQYARTTDGVNIAYWSLGEGPPLLALPAVGGSSTAATFAFPAYPASMGDLYTKLGTEYTIVGLDFRDHGHSDRGVEAVEVGDFAADAQAVAAAVQWKRFPIFATGWSVPVAIDYAAHHADQVSQLILHGPILRGPRSASVHEAIETLLTLNPAAGASAFAQIQGFEMADAKAFLESILGNPERDRLVEARLDFDVVTDLEDVRTPTLVVDAENYSSYHGDDDAPRRLATRLPDARLVDGPSDAASLATLVRDFLGDRPDNPHDLTPRELEVLARVAIGRRNTEIAAQLTISPATVTRHISNIFNKTGLSNRTELAHYAAEHGLAHQT
jgi:DNA-binding CsgD family transcriptional regulator/pimeloyl-ACP methyl ester carboxylesterase